MFGGLAFLVGGHMAVSASGQGGLLVRVDPDETERLVGREHVRRAEIRGRSMDGWLRVDDAGLRTKRQLGGWVTRGVTYAVTPRSADRPRRPHSRTTGAQAVQREAQVDDHGARDGSSGQGRRTGPRARRELSVPAAERTMSPSQRRSTAEVRGMGLVGETRASSASPSDPPSASSTAPRRSPSSSGPGSPPTPSPTRASIPRTSTASSAPATSPRRRCSSPRPSPSTAAGR